MMTWLILELIFVVCLGLSVSAQSSSEGEATRNPTAAGSNEVQKQSDAANAAKDTSAATGVQASKPASAQSVSVIGCLVGPDADGQLRLTSMQYRTGVEVSGPDSLIRAAGRKVKLLGTWEPAPATKTGAKAKRFQAADFEVMAGQCAPPAETTPVSKEKQKKQKAKADAAAAESGASPK